MKNWCDQDQIQHLHSHFGTNSTVVAMLCSVLGGPRYSFTVHGPEEFDRPERLSLKEKIGGAKFVVGVSSFGRSQLYRWCPFQQWPKVRVVRCGLPADYLEGPPPAPVTSRRLVCVGRLHEQKGTLLLLQAVALLAAQGSRFEITLVGDGPMRTDVEEFIRRRQLQSIVKLVGWQSGYEVREHLLASRAMVMPSFAEGLPVACMEALAMGRPVVATYIAGIPELIVPGRCGWLVPAGSVSALATAISEVLDASLDTLADMGHFGWQRVREFHDVRRETRKLCGFFSEEKQWADQ